MPSDEILRALGHVALAAGQVQHALADFHDALYGHGPLDPLLASGRKVRSEVRLGALSQLEPATGVRVVKWVFDAETELQHAARAMREQGWLALGDLVPTDLIPRREVSVELDAAELEALGRRLGEVAVRGLTLLADARPLLADDHEAGLQVLTS